MQYRQTFTNPFADGEASRRPFQAALYARGADHDEFARAVRINRTKHTVGHYPSNVMQTGVPYHSSLELAAMQWLDIQPCVRAYWPQPTAICYELESDLKGYTPDIWVALTDGREFMVEVKTRADARSEDNRRRWPYIAAALSADAYGFAFLLDDFLLAETLATHLRAIQRFKGAEFSPDRIWMFQTALDRHEGWPIAELLPIMQEHGFLHDELFALVLARHLWIDLRDALSMSSKVWIPGRAPRIEIWEDYNAA